MFSQSRAKKTPQQVIAGGVVRAARAGAGREEWMRIAIDELAMEPTIARVGIWLEPLQWLGLGTPRWELAAGVAKDLSGSTSAPRSS